MAKLSTEDVLKFARLARLQLTDAEVKQFQEEISAILGYVEQLQNVDLSKLEPTAQVTGLTNVTRPDEVREYEYMTEALLNDVPQLEGNHIKVKRMIG